MIMTVLRDKGFTLIEVLTVISIIAVIAAIAMVGYQKYAVRASSAELVQLYDGLRESAVIAADEQGIDLCRSPDVSILPDSKPVSPYAELSIEEVELHYARPLGLHFKADVHLEGGHNTDITREAYRILNKSHRVAPGAVVTDSVVSCTALLVNRPCAAPAHSASANTSTGSTSVANQAGANKDDPRRPPILPPASQSPASQDCNITPPVPCQDMYTGDCKTDFAIGSDPGTNACGSCVLQRICPKSCGVCQ